MILDEERFESKLGAIETARAWSPRAVSKLEAFLRTAPDAELFRINPFEYATARGVGVDEAVDLFLHAARAGLFWMDWNVVCPCCGLVTQSLRHMNELHADYACVACNETGDAT